MKAGKKVGVIVAVGLAAAATGIVVAAAFARWHQQHGQDEMLATRLRDIQDVLSDCDTKLRELDSHLVPTAAAPSRPGPATLRRNG